MATKDRRQHKDASPTERTLAEVRSRGWYAVPCEAWTPAGAPCCMCRTASFWRRSDFMGFADILALPVLLAIQTTSATNHQARVNKITRERASPAWWWLISGGRIEVWSWGEKKRPINGHHWQLRVTAITRSTLIEAGSNPPDIPAFLLDMDEPPPYSPKARANHGRRLDKTRERDAG
jgi:hypothetical protein